MCGREEENLDHLLLQCAKVQDLWALLLAIFGINWVLPCSVRESMAGWKGPFVREKKKLRKFGWQHPFSFLAYLKAEKQSCF